METIITGKKPRTTISSSSRGKLLRVLERLGPLAKVPPLGGWRKMGSPGLWVRMVSQVCVQGSARGMENMDQKGRTRFRRETSLRVWNEHGFNPDYMANVLESSKATRFHNRAAKKLRAIVDTPTAIKGVKVVLLDDLPVSSNCNVIRDELMRRCTVFRHKSASDFMITVGLSHDVIALDARVVGALQKHLHYNLKASKVQGNKEIYLSVENALRGVCKRAKVSLALLDRTLFQVAPMSALEYVTRSS